MSGMLAARGDSRGFSLLEVVAAMGLAAVLLGALGHLAAVAAFTAVAARETTVAAALASQKMEQLRGLAWGKGSDGASVSDLSTDVTLAVEQPSSGPGLSPSPPDSLDRSVAGYADVLDVNGAWIGAGSAGPPGGAAYVRRWSIRPLASHPDDALVVQVAVFSGSRRLASLAAVRTRTVP
jgi:prepilin-type N-terminal cleavage/methylation domain-containing protein